MFNYLVKRIFIAVFTIWVISLVAFSLTSMAPGDAVFCGTEEWDQDSFGSLRYEIAAQRRGLDKPLFYFNIKALAYPDSLHKFINKDKKECLSNLIAQNGNWSCEEKYEKSLQGFSKKIDQLPDSIPSKFVNPIRSIYSDLMFSSRTRKMESLLAKLANQLQKDSLVQDQLQTAYTNIERSYLAMQEEPTIWKLYIPSFHWYGLNNQYHHWIGKFLQGDFGISCSDSRPVIDKIKKPLYWTVVMSVLAIILAYLIAIPIGVYAATNHGKRFDRWSGIILFLLYSLPSFWLATLLVVFFTTPEYGEWTNIFASIGLGRSASDAPFWDRFWEAANHLVLPVICITYPALAFISRQMRGGILNVLQQDYIRTAKAKGVSNTKVIWKHAFRNGLFPIITLFANAFPAAVGGSIVVEVIFNIHGMGLTTLNAINAQDWPMVYAIMMLGAAMTIIGILVADIGYILADPRITFETKKT